MPKVPVLLLLAAFVLGDELPEHVLQLARLKANMKQALSTLPDYTCLSVTDRYRTHPRTGEIRHVDRVRLEVAFVAQREMFAWPGESAFSSEMPAEMIGSGLFSTGDFISHARAVFLGNYAVIRFAGETDVPGRKLLRWDYSISPTFSNYVVGHAAARANAGSTGSFWVDPRTLQLRMLEVRTDGLPPGFPITEARTLISYEKVRIGERDVLLPEQSVTTMTEASGGGGENRMEFSHCRQYGVQSAIRFDSDPGAVAAGPQEPRPNASISEPVEFILPANLRVPVALNSPIISDTAVVGQAIEAVVSEDVLDRKTVVVPRGATLTGRLRRVESNPGPPHFYVVSLEFTDVRFPNRHARFFASMIQTTKRTVVSGITYRVPDIPGVGTLVFEGDSFRLPKGTGFIWTTQDIRGRK